MRTKIVTMLAALLALIASPVLASEPWTILCTEDGAYDPCAIDKEPGFTTFIEAEHISSARKGDWDVQFVLYGRLRAFKLAADGVTRIEQFTSEWQGQIIHMVPDASQPSGWRLGYKKAGFPVPRPRFDEFFDTLQGGGKFIRWTSRWNRGTLFAMANLQLWNGNLSDLVAKRHWEFQIVSRSVAQAYEAALQDNPVFEPQDPPALP